MADGPAPGQKSFEPRSIIQLLVEHDVDFVVIGGVAGIAHGSVYPTYDLDITCGRELENLERLATVLRKLGVWLRGAPADLPLQLDGKMLSNGSVFTFEAEAGNFDVLLEPDGGPRYDALKDASMIVTDAGYQFRVASLDHLIAMKRAAGRDKDVRALTEYIAIAEEQRRLENDD